MKLKKCIDCSSYFPVTVLKKKPYLLVVKPIDWNNKSQMIYSKIIWIFVIIMVFLFGWLNNKVNFLKRLALTHNHGIYWTPIRNLPGIRQSEHKLHIHTSLVSITPLWQSMACFYTTVIISNEEKQLKSSL